MPLVGPTYSTTSKPTGVRSRQFLESGSNHMKVGLPSVEPVATCLPVLFQTFLHNLLDSKGTSHPEHAVYQPAGAAPGCSQQGQPACAES